MSMNQGLAGWAFNINAYRHEMTDYAAWLGIRYLLFLMVIGYLLLISPFVSAATTQTWEAVPTHQASVSLANPERNRRSNDAKVAISLKNTSGSELSGPLRLVITDLTPAAKVSIGNADGQTDTGAPYFDLTGILGNSFTVNGSGVVNVVVTGGGPNAFSFKARLEQRISRSSGLSIQITSPATLLTIGSTPQSVSGTVSDPTAQITLNGAQVNNSNGRFQGSVALTEGHNTVTARAVNAQGEDVSDVITLSLDMTPPYITVESPKDGDTVRNNKIAVSGLINDIVRGTVAEGQAHVKVNGIAASVANRSYLAENIPLSPGENTLKIDAADNVGNTASLSLKVTYQALSPQHIELLSGQNQSAPIHTALAQPLKVKLLDSSNKPVANKPVIYRVTEGDGIVGAGTADQGQGVLVQTDTQGVAATVYQLGSRAGTGNQRVRATAVGFDGEVLFHASARVGAGNKVTVNSGNNQRGAINQPLPQPLVVAVVDAGANVVPGAQIEYKVTQGSGLFQNGQNSITRTTDSDGRATAEYTLGSEDGLDVHRVSATLVGTALYAGFTASALKPAAAGQTRISGVVLDNQEQPLPNVTVRVDGTTREAQTDAQGQFSITEAPVGAVRLIADGSTTTAEGEYPTLAFNLVTIAGADNPLSAPIYLVKLDTVNAKTVGEQDVTLTLPEVPGFALEVKKGSVTFPDGKKTGKLSVTPVNASKIPMAPPNGMQPQFIVTIQPVGAKFDPPARLTLPNVDGHLPGAKVEMYSYDHDLEEFVAIGLGTVSTDGSVIKSNDGVGVIKAGWHCGSQPGGSGCTHNCGECASCDASCTCFWDNSKTPSTLSNTLGDCKKPGCQSGPKQVNDDSDKPADIVGDCKKPGCENGSPKPVNDASDKPDPSVDANNECKTCNNSGSIINDAGKDCKCTADGKGICNTGSYQNVGASPCGANVSITPSVTNLGNWPGCTEFGLTDYVRPPPKPTITACADTACTWSIRVGAYNSTVNAGACSGKTDISGSNDADVKKTSYCDIILDLTPDATGRPTRATYWSSSITTKHENFHVTEWETAIKGRWASFENTVEALTETFSCTANSSASAIARKQAAIDAAFATMIANTNADWQATGENPAYADGKADYDSLVASICTRAKNDGWAVTNPCGQCPP